MVDNPRPDATQPQVEGYTIEEPDVAVTSTSIPEDKTRSTLPSPPPGLLPVSKPSALAGQSTTNTGAKPPPLPPPESRPTNTTRNEAGDPRVVALKAIFPDYDEAVLQSVLESVDGNQDRAVDLLLGMNDPDFRSEAPPPAQQPPTIDNQTQEELDEQLARRLMLEEQQQAQQWQQSPRPHRRSSRMQGQQQTQQTVSPPLGGKDTMSEIQGQIGKYAEIGKKNFSALVSKVKAKIQEFDKPDAGGSGSGVQSSWSNSGSPAYYGPNATSQSPPLRTNYQPYHGQHTSGGIQIPPATTPANTAISQPAAFYDPNPSPQPVSPPTQSVSPPLFERPVHSSISVEGYDVEPLPSTTSGSSPALASHSAHSKPPAATIGSNFSASVPPRGPSPANPIDGGKLGLLPKRPISLIRDPPQPQSQEQQQHEVDSDDLEYAESPFDEGRK